MYYELNHLPIAEDNYDSYIAVNSGIDVEFFSVHDNPDDWTFKEEEYETLLIDIPNLIIYNSFGNDYVNGKSLVQNVTPTIMAQYIPPDTIIADEMSFDIYRKTPYQKYLEYVCPMNDVYKMYDYGICSNNYYHYVAVATLKTGDVSDPYRFVRYSQKNTITKEDEYYYTSFNNWTICDIIEQSDNYYYKVGDTWNLGLNLDISAVSLNLNISSWDTLGRYSKTVLGNCNYDSGRFSGLLGNIYEYTDYKPNTSNYKNSTPKQVTRYTERMEYFVGDEYHINGNTCSENNWSVEKEYGIEIEKLNAWKEFVSDGNLKLLKDTKGNAWIIQVVDNPEYNINYSSNIKQTQIGFSWKEVADISVSSIVSFDNLE